MALLHITRIKIELSLTIFKSDVSPIDTFSLPKEIIFVNSDKRNVIFMRNVSRHCWPN